MEAEPACSVRPAGEGDLSAIYDIWFETEIVDDNDPPPPGSNPWFAHVLAGGRMAIAEDSQRRAVGFAGVRPAGEVCVLTDLFVRPDAQRGGIGTALLDAVLPKEGPRATLASSDPKALSLYVRRGLRPWWPCYWVGGDAGAAATAVAARPAAPLVTLDVAEEHSGLPDDEVRYWVDVNDAVVLASAGGGMALVTLPSPHLLKSREAATVAASHGPTSALASEVLLGAIQWAIAAGAPGVLTQVPGPHPALPTLLGAGFKILDTDTCCATAPELVLDPTRTTFFGDALIAP